MLQHSEVSARVSLPRGGYIAFYDTGSSISVVEVLPVTERSTLDQLVNQGLSPRDMFGAIANGEDEPSLFLRPYADRRATVKKFRDYDAYGFAASCWLYKNPANDWGAFIESAYPQYDSYNHWQNELGTVDSFTTSNISSYRASTCPTDYVYNGYSGLEENVYMAYRDPPGAVGMTWLFSLEVPINYRMIHWDDPGADGYRWRMRLDSGPTQGCSFICTQGRHSTSQMWDW